MVETGLTMIQKRAETDLTSCDDIETSVLGRRSYPEVISFYVLEIISLGKIRKLLRDILGLLSDRNLSGTP